MLKELVSGFKTASEKSKIIEEAQEQIRKTGEIEPETLRKYEENRCSRLQFDLWFIIGEGLYRMLAPKTFGKGHAATADSLERKYMEKERITRLFMQRLEEDISQTIIDSRY